MFPLMLIVPELYLNVFFFVAYDHNCCYFFILFFLFLSSNPDGVFFDRPTTFPEQLDIHVGYGRSPMALESNDLLGNMR